MATVSLEKVAHRIELFGKEGECQRERVDEKGGDKGILDCALHIIDVVFCQYGEKGTADQTAD